MSRAYTPSMTIKFEMTPEAVNAAYDAVDLPGADAPLHNWESAFWHWNDIKLRISGEYSRRYFKEAQDTRVQEAVLAFRFMREHIIPIQERRDAEIRTLFLQCPLRAQLEKVLGHQLFRRFELDAAAFSPLNIDLITREGELVSMVQRANAAAELVIDGKTYTLAQCAAMLNDASESVRISAWRGLAEFQNTHAAQLHTWFDELVELRTRMAHNLNETTFVPLGYRKMGRSDYGSVGLRPG